MTENILIFDQTTKTLWSLDELRGPFVNGGGQQYNIPPDRLFAAAPDLLWFAEQVINGLETGMIRIETPADETLATVLARGRAAISKAKKESQP